MPSSGGLPNPGIKPMSLPPPALAGRFFSAGATWEGRAMSESVSNSAAEPVSPQRAALFTISSVTPQPPAHPGPLR